MSARARLFIMMVLEFFIWGAWLPLIFGVYFAIKLAGAGEGPPSASRAILVPVLGIVLIFVGVGVSFLIAPQPASPSWGTR